MQKYYISAYAASPSAKNWGPEKEADYFYQLSQDARIAGIEHPFYLPNSNKYPIEWLRQNVHPTWNLQITAMPAVMTTLLQNPHYGIASIDENDRKAAVNLIKAIHSYTQELNDSFGRKLVQAIHIHTAPRNEANTTRGNATQLIKSLEEINHWDWHGAQLNLEHCDASRKYQPEKGFLSLEDEINAIQQFPHMGIILNWARSAIETRSTSGPLLHLRSALETNCLRGFVFSGCTDVADNLYGQWKDTHSPPQKIIPSEYLINESLLGKQEIRQVFQTIADTQKSVYFGIKVGDPSQDSDVKKKVALNIDTLNAIEFAINQQT